MDPYKRSSLSTLAGLLMVGMIGCVQPSDPPVTNVTIEAPEEPAPVTEEPTSDLLIGNVVGWYGVEEGHSLQAPFLVTNQSDHDVIYTVAVSANPEEDFILFSDASRTLTPGSEALVVVLYTAPEDITSEFGYQSVEAFITLETDADETHELWLHVDVWDSEAFYGEQELYVWATELWMNADAGGEAMASVGLQAVVQTGYTAVFSDEHDSGFTIAEGASGTLAPGDTPLIIVQFQAPDALVEDAYQLFWNILTITSDSGELHQVLVRADVYDPTWTPPSEE